MIQSPIVLALVRRSDEKLLALPGLQKLDLPASYVSPGTSLTLALSERLRDLRLSVRELVFRWGAVCAWGGNQRPVHAFEAVGWTGEPADVCVWSTEEEIGRGPRSELYRRMFAKLAMRGQGRFDGASQSIVEAPLVKPQTFCPRCKSSLKLRNRKPGEQPTWDCRTCTSAWMLGRGELVQIPRL